ncbi:MAG: hypothetical protein V4813_05460 [Gemmatimonadota bacterium]
MLRSFSTRITVALLLIGCSTAEPSRTDSATAPAGGVSYAYDRVPLDTSRRPDAVIDSVFPMPEMLRRFREGLPTLTALDGGATSRQALAEQFVAALAARDTRTLGQLTLSRAEFAWVYFPNSPDAVMPNGLSPQLRWTQITLDSEKGISRALERIGGSALTLAALDCPNPPVTTGALALHDGCTVALRRADGTMFRGRLFGPILETGGRFKFAGYSNDM